MQDYYNERLYVKCARKLKGVFKRLENASRTAENDIEKTKAETAYRCFADGLRNLIPEKKTAK